MASATREMRRLFIDRDRAIKVRSSSNLYAEFLRRFAEVIARAHGVAIRAGVGNQDYVACLRRRRQQAIVSQDVRAFADWADDIDELVGRFLEPRQIHDLVMRSVKSRAQKRIHPRGDPDVAYATLGFELRDAGQQHTRCGDEITAWLDPDLEARICAANAQESAVE